MSVHKKMASIVFCSMAVTVIMAMPCIGMAQIGNNPPPSSASGVGTNSGPFDHADGGSGDGGINADASGDDDPGGPVLPPDDVVPLDGGVSILLSIGLVHGYLITRKKKNRQAVTVTLK